MKKYDDEKIKEVLGQLEQGVRNMFTSKAYTTYLDTMSKFHSYSLNNCILIAAQRPDATQVAGYVDWKKKFDRQVQANEKGIKIIAFSPRKISVTEEQENEQGEREIVEVKKEIPNYRVVYVYDISQTTGKELPEICHKLEGDMEQFEEIKQAIVECASCPVEVAEIQGNANGYYSLTENKIVVKDGMEQSQTIKTMLHELAHSMLHNNIDEAKDMPRETKEVQAESVAYVVSGWLGLDTSAYTFGYVSGWSSGKETKELLESASVIRDTSKVIIEQLAERLGVELEIKPTRTIKAVLAV